MVWVIGEVFCSADERHCGGCCGDGVGVVGVSAGVIGRSDVTCERSLEFQLSSRSVRCFRHARLARCATGGLRAIVRGDEMCAMTVMGQGSFAGPGLDDGVLFERSCRDSLTTTTSCRTFREDTLLDLARQYAMHTPRGCLNEQEKDICKSKKSPLGQK